MTSIIATHLEALDRRLAAISSEHTAAITRYTQATRGATTDTVLSDCIAIADIENIAVRFAAVATTRNVFTHVATNTAQRIFALPADPYLNGTISGQELDDYHHECGAYLNAHVYCQLTHRARSIALPIYTPHNGWTNRARRTLAQETLTYHTTLAALTDTRHR